MLVATTAVLGGRGGSGSTGQPVPHDDKINRIAYVGLDAVVTTIDPDGSDPRRVSPTEGVFTWPTWSPDGRSIVYSGIVGADDSGRPRIGLYAFNRTSGESSAVHLGQPGVVGLLAEGVVHYPLWSPDSSRLAFVVVTSRALTLFVDVRRDGADPRPIMERGPLWMSWSHDSRNLLVHRDEDHFLVDTDMPGDIRVSELGFDSFGYRVPAWKPGEDTVVVVSQNSPDTYGLLEADVVGNRLVTSRHIAEVSGRAAFLWSPQGERLAVTGEGRLFRYQGLTMLLYRGLTVRSESLGPSPTEVEDDVLAFFWSPDGTRLAYVTLSDTRGALRWMVMDVGDGSRWPAADFIPSRDQLTMFQFFDQYAYSHSLWAPDSSALVFAGRLSSGPTTASRVADRTAQTSHIIVMDAGQSGLADIIADGILGFWSPR